MNALRITLVLLLFSLTACRAAETSPALPPPGLDLGDLVITEIDDGLWLYVSTFEMANGPVESNGLVVVGPDGVVVLDTPWNDELTSKLLDWAAQQGPILGVVATHFHADRLGGIAEVHRRGLASYGHEETARLALENDLEAPQNTFTESFELTTGDRSIEFYYPGGGHAPDNIVAWIPEDKVLFGGCLLKATGWKGLGYIGDAVLDDWGPSLERLLKKYPNAEVVYPGHGDVGSLDVVRHTLKLVRAHNQESERPGAAAHRHRGVSWVAGRYEVTAEMVDRLVASHVNWIVQTPFGWQDGIDGTVSLKTSGRIFWGERDAGLETTTRLAQAAGIRTLLKPHIWIRNSGDKWRSDIEMPDEASWDAWFESYETFILHYARLAEELDIAALAIGTELWKTAIARPDDWRRIIRNIRTVYSGELTYAANWWREYQEIPFWSDLDYIGIQGYFPLTDQERPSFEAMKSGWKGHVAEIEALQARHDLPVLFTEIGYKSTPGTTVEPWAWIPRDERTTRPVDLEQQADAYRAFFEVFWHRDWVAGAYFWKWFPSAGPDTEMLTDPDFTPQGKPAEKVLAKWYGGA